MEYEFSTVYLKTEKKNLTTQPVSYRCSLFLNGSFDKGTRKIVNSLAIALTSELSSPLVVSHMSGPSVDSPEWNRLLGVLSTQSFQQAV